MREERMGTSVIYSQGGLVRTTWSRPDGSSHDLIIDEGHGRIFSWSASRPDQGLGVRELKRRRPPITHWGAQPKAQRGGRCSAAGETGYSWRIHRPKNFKQGERISEACIARDGVVLSELQDRPPGVPALMDWRATTVIRGPILPGTFSPPDRPQHGEH